MKNVARKSQHGFTKGKSRLTNMSTFYNKVTCSVDVGQTVDIIYVPVSKALDMISIRLLLEN